MVTACFARLHVCCAVHLVNVERHCFVKAIQYVVLIHNRHQLYINGQQLQPVSVMCVQVLLRKSQTSSYQQEREAVFIHSYTTFPLKAGEIWSEPVHQCWKLVPYVGYRWARVGHPHHPVWNACICRPTSLIDWCTSSTVFYLHIHFTYSHLVRLEIICESRTEGEKVAEINGCRTDRTCLLLL